MKKILAMFLVLIMMMTVVGSAMAANITGYDPAGTPPTYGIPNDGQTFTLTKNYDITYTGAQNPADTLQFTVSAGTFENAGVDTPPSPVPAVTIANVPVALGSTSANITVQLPTYTVPGVYSYTITENDTNKAGVGYLSDTLYLVVTVINDPDPSATPGDLIVAGIAVHQGAADGTKIDSFTNTYDAGTLYIDKTVTGNMGDTSKVWNFTVTLVAPTGDTVNAPITIEDTTTYTSFKEGTTDVPATGIAAGWTGTKTLALQLTHGQSIKLNNIPAGVKYTVAETETGADGYTTSGEVTTATAVVKGTDHAVNVVNDKTITVDTGISLDTVPYIMIMALAFAGIVVLMSKKRREQN